MKVVIVGGGESAHAIARAVIERGDTAELFSRSTGFDVLRDDATARLAGADVIVEATGRFTTSRKIATQFFTTSTTAISAAANAVGATHILLSIVNCDLPGVQGYGYFAGKAAQEKTARTASDRLIIVRTTQWFEFAYQTLDRMGFGPLGLVPRMRIQPVGLDAVASVIAQCVAGQKPGTTLEIAGPEVMTLREMTRQVRPTRAVRIPLVLPGATWSAINGGALLPSDKAKVTGTRFSDWLTDR